MIRCVEVSKRYEIGGRRVDALRGLSLAIDAPGFYAIMGQSGSGKSTLLHLLAALDKPDAGTLEVAGRAVHTMGEEEATAYRRGVVGVVFQSFNLIPTLTAVENVELPGLLAGESPGELRGRAEELLTKLGIGDRAEHRPDAMSGGEQQRVAIARSLLLSPPVLLADEPTGNLDSASSEGLWGLLGSVARDFGVTIVMVTHEPAAAAHCAKVFVMRDGKLHGTFDTEGRDAAGIAARYQQCLRQE
jgi:putative ABC transport system ATP-binding protein